MPPISRLRESVQEHFKSKFDLYSGAKGLVQKIHVEPVVENLERVVDYTLKTIASGRLSYDEAVIVLPRARQELAT
jgi:hypothetical protein